jgi:hypothetical protein
MVQQLVQHQHASSSQHGVPRQLEPSVCERSGVGSNGERESAVSQAAPVRRCLLAHVMQRQSHDAQHVRVADEHAVLKHAQWLSAGVQLDDLCMCIPHVHKATALTRKSLHLPRAPA